MCGITAMYQSVATTTKQFTTTTKCARLPGTLRLLQQQMSQLQLHQNNVQQLITATMVGKPARDSRTLRLEVLVVTQANITSLGYKAKLSPITAGVCRGEGSCQVLDCNVRRVEIFTQQLLHNRFILANQFLHSISSLRQCFLPVEQRDHLHVRHLCAFHLKQIDYITSKQIDHKPVPYIQGTKHLGNGLHRSLKLSDVHKVTRTPQ